MSQIQTVIVYGNDTQEIDKYVQKLTNRLLEIGEQPYITHNVQEAFSMNNSNNLFSEPHNVILYSQGDEITITNQLTTLIQNNPNNTNKKIVIVLKTSNINQLQKNIQTLKTQLKNNKTIYYKSCVADQKQFIPWLQTKGYNKTLSYNIAKASGWDINRAINMINTYPQIGTMNELELYHAGENKWIPDATEIPDAIITHNVYRLLRLIESYNLPVFLKIAHEQVLHTYLSKINLNRYNELQQVRNSKIKLKSYLRTSPKVNIFENLQKTINSLLNKTLTGELPDTIENRNYVIQQLFLATLNI